MFRACAIWSVAAATATATATAGNTPSASLGATPLNSHINIPRPASTIELVETATLGKPQRIYKSIYPSILGEAKKYHSLCHFMFGKWDSADPATVALIQAETKQQFTYPQLRQMTHKAACVLYHAYGIRKGDCVALVLMDHIMYPPLTYGILELGAVITTASGVTTPDVLSPQMEASQAKVIISTHKFRPIIEGTVSEVQKQTGKEIRILYMEDIDEMDVGELPSNYTAKEEAKPEDVAFIPFSSGTTGAPKGVQLTNWSLTTNLIQAAPFNAWSGETFISVLPFFHIYGFATVMSSPLAAIATQVVMMAFNASVYLQAMEEYKVDGAFMAPPMVNALVHRIESQEVKANLSSLKFCVCAAAPLSNDIASRFHKYAPNAYLGQGWGMTEMSPVVTAGPRQNPTINYEVCGALVPNSELRVIKVDDSQQSGADKSSGEDVPEGEEGEIWVRGPQMMKGYLNDEDTAKTIQDGWYRTGDIGRMLPGKNALVITDRLKELIKYKGFQVSPVSLEKVLMTHPWVRDCIIVGVPDPRDVSFEMPRALVMLKDNISNKDAVRASDELYRFFMKQMPPHKRLHGGVRIVDNIPRNASGKLMRRQTRQAEIEYLHNHA